MAANLATAAFLLAGTTAWAQDSPPRAEVSSGTIPGSAAPTKTFHYQRDASAYVNPSTGSMIPVPALPPKVGPVDEWKPVKLPAPVLAPAEVSSIRPGLEEVSSIRPAAFQQPPEKGRDMRAPSEALEEEVQIQLEPPGPEAVFKRESERNFMERLRQISRQQKTTRYDFPDEPVLSTEKYAGRNFPPMNQLVEPNYLCYGRLLFEDKNSERYGWDLGFIQPFVSTGIFFWDMVALPYHSATAPCRCFECNAGYCLPGDPVPYLLYPPELSLTGLAWEAGVVVALFAIFPG
jgi:hypothetical protein